jgi:hypothetical protein
MRLVKQRRSAPCPTRPKDLLHRPLKGATLWKNATDNRSYYSVDIVRSYRDKNGEWQEVF